MVTRLTGLGIAVAGLTAAAASFEIVLPKEPTPAEETAAQELRHYLERTVDGRLSVEGRSPVRFVIGDSPEARAAGILVTNLAEEAWRIRSSGGDVVLAGGGRRGTLYAAYHFLEDVMGVCWWNASEEDLPAPVARDLPKLDLSGKPYFLQRDMNFGSGWNHEAAARWAARNRMNRFGDDYKIGAAYGGMLNFGGPHFVHTFALYIPKAKYFDQHPEWFSLNKEGKRVGEPLKSQLCLTKEEMRKAFLAEVKTAIERDEASTRKAGVPPPQIYDISCNDCWEPCQCAACQAVAKAEESESGPLIHFVNWMADELAKFRPGLHVSTLAYFHTHKPPKAVRPRDNVFIRLCDTDTNQAFDYRAGRNRAFPERMREWHAITKNLAIWDYSITYGASTGLPFPHEYTLPYNFAAFAKNGVSVYFTEHEHVDIADMHTLTSWLEAKLMENPYADFGALHRNFMERYYGAAAPLVTAYREAVRDAARDNGADIDWFAGVANFGYLKRPVVRRCQSLLDQAEQAVAHDPARLARVGRARLSLDRYVGLNKGLFNDELAEDDADGRARKAAEEELRACVARMEKNWRASIAALEPGSGMVKTSEQKLRENLATAKTPLMTRSEKFKGRKGVLEYAAGTVSIWNDSAEVVEDGEAEGGCAVRLALPDDVGKYALPMPCGLYSVARKKGLGGGKIAAEHVPGPGYHWVKLFSAAPERTAYVYFFWSWVVQYPLGLPQEPGGDAYTFWAKIKFTGPAFPHARAGEKNAIYIERVALEKNAPAGQAGGK